MALLGAAVVAVPIFKRIGLGSIVGYLVAGIAIGPFGLKLFREPGQILSVAEFGVVLLLFVIGLELKPSRLWALQRRHLRPRRGAGDRLRRAAHRRRRARRPRRRRSPSWRPSGLALSSTAIVMQILEERGETTETHGQKTFSVLLLQDLAIVPLLAALAVIAPHHVDGGQSRLAQIAIAVGADRRRRRRRPLPAQSAVPGPGRGTSARDHDGGGAAGRARRGAGHAGRRPVDGDGRLHRRRAPVGIELPPPARSRHRAVPRPAARPLLPRRRHVHRPQPDRRPVAAGAGGGGRSSWWSRSPASTASPASSATATATRCGWRCCWPQGGEFAFVLFTTAQGLGLLDRRHLGAAHRRRDRVDGADAAGADPARALPAGEARIARRHRRCPTGSPAARWSSASAASARSSARRCWRAAST